MRADGPVHVPPALMWLAVSERVGGYLNYLALLEDARAYDDVMIAMAGEVDAAKVRQLLRKN